MIVKIFFEPFGLETKSSLQNGSQAQNSEGWGCSTEFTKSFSSILESSPCILFLNWVNEFIFLMD